MTKQEYMRARKTALKRIARLESAGLSTQLLKNYEGGAAFPAYSSLKGNTRARLKASRRLESFLSAKTSTVSGARKTQRKTLETIGAIQKTSGFRKATPEERAIFAKKTVEAFGQFMKAAREATSDTMFDSERAVQAFKISLERGLNPRKIAKAFDKWQSRNVDTKIEKRKTAVTDEDLNRYLGEGTKDATNQRGRSNGRTDRGNGRAARSRAKSKAQAKKRR